MFRQPHFTFIYLPGDQEQSRRFRLPRIVALGVAVGVLALLALAVCYVSGVGRPGGSARVAMVENQNDGLRQELARLEQKVALLRSDLTASWDLQSVVAATVGLDTVDSGMREAGIGGRQPLVENRPPADLVEARVVALDATLEQMLRQARMQRQGYQAILDTLQERVALREALPSIRPVRGGFVSSVYGRRTDPFTDLPAFHQGMDFSVPMGSPVLATAGGQVRDVILDKGFGHMVVLQHDERTQTRYAHLSKPLVKRGQQVKRGDVIALSGRSGRATSAHLHYEVIVNGRAVNPKPYILNEFAHQR